jgi:hypothetical protein
LDLDQPARRKAFDTFGEILRWAPMILCMLLAAACLIAGAAGEGVEVTMPAAMGGFFAAWAALLRSTGMPLLPDPRDPSAR